MNCAVLDFDGDSGDKGMDKGMDLPDSAGTGSSALPLLSLPAGAVAVPSAAAAAATATGLDYWDTRAQTYQTVPERGHRRSRCCRCPRGR
jgi:hypothetical protein